MSTAERNVIIAGLVVAISLRKSDWCCGNEYAALLTAADEYYKALSFAKCDPPIEVRRAIVHKAMRDDFKNLDYFLRELQPNGDGSFGFMYAGMYHGVESDGYIHT